MDNFINPMFFVEKKSRSSFGSRWRVDGKNCPARDCSTHQMATPGLSSLRPDQSAGYGVHAANGPETFSKDPARMQLSSTKEGFPSTARIWALFANWSQQLHREIIACHHRAQCFPDLTCNPNPLRSLGSFASEMNTGNSSTIAHPCPSVKSVVSLAEF
jgi:hypothetical protein